MMKDSATLYEYAAPNPHIFVAEYDAKIFLKLITNKHKHPFNFWAHKNGQSFNPKQNSQRYELFSKNTKCANCDINGTVVVLEKGPKDKTPHFNLYGLNDEGKRVLMTKDHIKPKSLGGLNAPSNYQTMCIVCNELKGSDYGE